MNPFLCGVLIEKAKLSRKTNRENLQLDNIKYGRVCSERRGKDFVDVWKDGSEGEELKKLAEEEKRLTTLTNSLKSKSKKGDNTQAWANCFLYERKYAELKELRQKLAYTKSELERQKWRLIRETRRLEDEKNSNFNNFVVFKERYQLLNLLGKGGFSEVYEAFDLETFSYVACKFHTLNPIWSEARKEGYIKHACREYNIHKELNHPNVVSLIDVFNVNEDTFCTVLEKCGGGDLDLYIKRNKIIPEKEARAIISQVFEGLKYLHNLERPIIHYDLKPGNILFDLDGTVKITDFGLSKIMENDDDEIELTSQGAGTYWYLPPEAFAPQGEAMIGTKLDVWSAGIILYQMVFGEKPFGNNVTQQRFYTEKVYQKAVLNFPADSKVSQDTRDIISRCLSREVMLRPDSKEVCEMIHAQNTKPHKK